MPEPGARTFGFRTSGGSNDIREKCADAMAEMKGSSAWATIGGTLSDFSKKVELEDQFLCLDRKMDYLTTQLDECMQGIRVIYKMTSNVVASTQSHQNAISPRPPLSPRVNKTPDHFGHRLSPGGPQVGQPTAHAGDCSNLSADGTPSENPDKCFIPTASRQSAQSFVGYKRSLLRRSQTSYTISEDANKARKLFASAGRSTTITSEKMAEVFGGGPGRSGGLEQPETRNSVQNLVDRRQRLQGSIALHVWNFLDNPESGMYAMIYNRLMPVFILVSVLFSLAESISEKLIPEAPAFYTELAIEAIFLAEIILRFVVCPNRWAFFTAVYNIIDIISVAPLGIRLVYYRSYGNSTSNSTFQWLLLEGLVPAMRLLKTWRRFDQIHLLKKAFLLAFQATPVMIFIYLAIWFVFSALVFVAEEQNLKSLGEAFWLTFCSMTSSMFGDVYPKTTIGKVIVSVLVTTSTLYMAIPIGIIGTCFAQVWEDRDRILLTKRLRHIFNQNGFTAYDLPDMFVYFDPDGNGLLSLDEFVTLSTTLQLGLSEDRLVSLFQVFDNDGSGGIDAKEFCKIIFPEQFYFIYGQCHEEQHVEKSWFPNFLR